MASKYHLPLVIAVYTITCILLYPSYQFIFDLDGIGYLSMTKRLAAGDVANGINGFWPPLHSWLAIPLYLSGMNEFMAFKVLNGLFGAGVLVVLNRLLKKLAVSANLSFIALMVCIPITLSYVYGELAADLLLCFLLLVYIDITTEKDFFTNPYKNIAAGLVGCLAYLAKTYALPFFFLHYVLLHWLLYHRSALPRRKKIAVKNLLLGMGAFALLAVPWVVILYNRLHFFTFGHVLIFGQSGQFNLLHYFKPNLSFNNPLIVAPPQPLTCYWENPLSVLVHQPHYYKDVLSFSMVVQQIRTVLYNFIVLLKNLHSFSFLCNFIILALALYVWQKKPALLTRLLLMMVVFPAGYLLLHVEDRFVWLMSFLALPAGIVLSQLALQNLKPAKPIQMVYWCLFFGSFVITPIDHLKDWSNSGEQLFQLSDELQAKGVQGKFLSDNATDVQRLAYLTGSVYYMPGRAYRYDEMLAACRQHGIQYYFFYYTNTQQLDAFRHTAFYASALREIPVKFPNLLLLKLN